MSVITIDELNKHRRVYLEKTALAAELDMKVLANGAEGRRLETALEVARGQATEARREVERLEELPIEAVAPAAKVTNLFESLGAAPLAAEA